MPDLWMPGADRMPVGNTAPTDTTYPPKAVAHITWDRNASAAAPADLVPYETLRSYFGTNPAGRAVAPHLLWDPFTGRVTQFFPADSRSLSLADGAGGTRTNRAGRVVVQIEALFFPYCRTGGQVYATLADTPCRGWPELLAWVRSWGVPDAWPMGRPTGFDARRSESTWETRGGWYAHAHVPENDHTDPGTWPGFTPLTEVADMTPDQAQQLAELHAYAGWGYRNAGDDAASVAAGRGHIPDAYGYLRGTGAAVQALTAQVGALTATLAALTASGGLTAEQVTTAAQAGAHAALAELGDALTTKAA